MDDSNKQTAEGVERQPVGPQGLGDRVEFLLRRVGIHGAIKKHFGDCGCENRKEWLNKLAPERMTADQAVRFENLLRAETKTAQPYFDIYNDIHGTTKRPKSCGQCNERVISKLWALYEKTYR